MPRSLLRHIYTYDATPCRPATRINTRTPTASPPYNGTSNTTKAHPTPRPPLAYLQVDYYGFRYYSAELGRWINRDPIGVTGDIGEYIFTNNRPIDSFDYLGLTTRAEWNEQLRNRSDHRKKINGDCCYPWGTLHTEEDLRATSESPLRQEWETFQFSIGVASGRNPMNPDQATLATINLARARYDWDVTLKEKFYKVYECSQFFFFKYRIVDELLQEQTVEGRASTYKVITGRVTPLPPNGYNPGQPFLPVPDWTGGVPSFPNSIVSPRGWTSASARNFPF